MTYADYLKFYNLEDNDNNYEAWINNEWLQGRAYQHNGKFYSVDTNKELSKENKS